MQLSMQLSEEAHPCVKDSHRHRAHQLHTHTHKDTMNQSAEIR